MIERTILYRVTCNAEIPGDPEKCIYEGKDESVAAAYYTAALLEQKPGLQLAHTTVKNKIAEGIDDDGKVIWELAPAHE